MPRIGGVAVNELIDVLVMYLKLETGIWIVTRIIYSLNDRTSYMQG